MIRSMRMRITLGFVLVMAPFLVLLSHLILVGTGRMRQDETNAVIDRTLKLGAERLRSPNWREGLTELFRQDEVQRQDIGGLVANLDEQVLWRSDSNPPQWPDPPRNSTRAVPYGELTLFVRVPDLPTNLDAEARGLALHSLAAVCALAIGSWLVVGRTLLPIRSLSRQAAEAGANDARARLVPPSQDLEMRELVTTLNGFLDRAQEASEEKTRFYAAASHELRTPLQALSGHLEVTLGQSRTEAEYQATVQEAYAQTQRLVSLVESILLLHQLQSSDPAVGEPVCLSEEIESQIQSIRPLAEARGLRLCVSVETGIVVTSIPMHVSVLIRNLVENAAKYSNEAGEVKILLQRASGSTMFRIENEVATGSLDEARLYEPFFRPDASRSGKSGGNGLGLAICRAGCKG